MKKIYPSAIMVLFTVGCAGQALQPAAPAASSPPTPAVSVTVGVEPGAAASLPGEPSPTVRLLDAGAGPRRQLRYRFRLGAVEHSRVDVKLRMSLAMALSPGRRTMAMDMPTMRMGFRTAVTEVLPGGAARFAVEIEDARLLGDGSFDDDTRRAVEAELAGMIDIRGSSRMSAHGEESEIVFDRTNASPAQQGQLDRMQDSLRDTSVRFPEGEVGIGARWEVTSRVRAGLFMVDRRMIFTLTRLSGSAATLDFEVAMSASPQTLQLDTGQTGVLHSFEGHGSGTTTVGLDRFAQTATMKSSAAAEFSIGSGAEAADASMALDMDIALSSKPPTGSRRAGLW